MTRLIDADTLIKKLQYVYSCDYIDSKSKEGIASDIIDEIDNAPTVEPKKGKWIRQAESRTIFFCSNCGREINTYPFTRTDNFPFCHCGADMRGDEE